MIQLIEGLKTEDVEQTTRRHLKIEHVNYALDKNSLKGNKHEQHQQQQQAKIDR